jgi:primary-amine oxidase
MPRVPSVDRPMLVRDEDDCEAPGLCSDDGKELVSTEGGLDWIPEEFTTLEIEDHDLVNARGRHTGYHLVPLRSGAANHREAYTRSDFWVTRYRSGEMLAASLPTYARREPVDGQDLVVWYTGTAHHEDEPRDEDRDTVPILWVGFQLEPHNFFTGTPFYE